MPVFGLGSTGNFPNEPTTVHSTVRSFVVPNHHDGRSEGVEVGRLDCSGGMVRKGHDGWSEAQRSFGKNDGFRWLRSRWVDVSVGVGGWCGSFFVWGVEDGRCPVVEKKSPGVGYFLFWERCE